MEYWLDAGGVASARREPQVPVAQRRNSTEDGGAEAPPQRQRVAL